MTQLFSMQCKFADYTLHAKITPQTTGLTETLGALRNLVLLRPPPYSLESLFALLQKLKCLGALRSCPDSILCWVRHYHGPAFVIVSNINLIPISNVLVSQFPLNNFVQSYRRILSIFEFVVFLLYCGHKVVTPGNSP